MARYTGPAYRKARRVGFSLLESGKDIARRPYGPGQHGAERKGKSSNYGTQLKEKQKVRFMYGLTEKQFRKTFNEASKMEGIQGENFLKLLESRLDNVVYRMGMAATRRAARQLVNHGHILVDGKKVDIPSYLCKPGQTIQLKETSKNLVIVKEALEATVSRVAFVSFDEATGVGTFVRLPERSEILPEIRENLIVEFYNR